MLFHSLVFVLFAVLFYLVWPLVKGRQRPRWIWLTGMSFVFYGWWDWRFLLLILASGILDFLCALGMERYPERRGQLLLVSVLGNVGSLAIFKYLDFLIGSLGTFLAWISPHLPGLPSAPTPVGLTLPVGISFYTFQSMSYTIDVYRGQVKPVRSLWHFMAYLAMFPQLVAGPIVRAATLLPQLEGAPPDPDDDALLEGTRWLVHGYFKKAVIADNLAPFIEQVFSSHAGEFSGATWWMATLAFHFQIYCDFSGYSDIARGLARWMGYEFPRNFDHPYGAASIREFWRRWHQTLSSWFYDYVFIPLGAARGGWRTALRNLWITFLLSGLWHGAAWKFVVWGAVHAAFISVEQGTRWPERVRVLRGGRLLSVLVTWLCLQASWVLFRAEGLEEALAILSRMFTLAPGAGASSSDRVWIWIAVILGREIYLIAGGDQSRFARSPRWRTWEPVLLVALLWGAVFLRGPGTAFLYFQF